MDQVQNGMRLSIQDLSKLRPTWKNAYQSTIISEDHQVQKQVDGMHGRVTQELHQTKEDITKLKQVKKEYM